MSTESATGYSRKNPFPATLKKNELLTKGGSEKETRHYEISLAGSGLAYEVGDSLGIFPTNDPALVDAILEALELTGQEPVLNPAAETVPLRQALLSDFVIAEPSKQLLQAVGERDPSAASLVDLIGPEQKTSLDAYLWGRDVLDILAENPAAKFTAEEFVKTLRKLQPRLYSIASSLKAFPEEVHLTIASVRFTSLNRGRKGVCSTYLADRVGDTGTVPVFVHTAKHFRVPENLETSMIMVGPGTGVAPFRAFLQERKATGATGKNWLFFGEQRSAADFFYREEFEGYLADGTLARFDTAFSRDQEYKIYVQHRMLEAADEIWEWVSSGSYFYVCGDAARMAKDVDAALVSIVEKSGGKSPEDAKAYVEAMKKEKRYRKDVY